MTQLTTIDTNNYAAMAKAMGIANEKTSAREKSSTLARMRINHKPIMGLGDVNGKKVNMEVVPGGLYRIDMPDGISYYAPTVKIRPFLTRFMYKRFVKGMGDKPNMFVKSIMADDLNIDLKDNVGGFNCGKPAGYIEDFKSLPADTQKLIKEIKRVRVILGTVEMVNPVDAEGNSVVLDVTPFIWEIDNRDAFKTVGANFTQFAKLQLLPVQHTIIANTEERKANNGDSFYLPITSLDVSNQIDLTEKDQDMFGDFMLWLDNYNSYIANEWAKKANSHLPDEDSDVVDDIIDIDIDEEDAA
jgi:hypothetical protein